MGLERGERETSSYGEITTLVTVSPGLSSTGHVSGAPGAPPTVTADNETFRRIRSKVEEGEIGGREGLRNRTVRRLKIDNPGIPIGHTEKSPPSRDPIDRKVIDTSIHIWTPLLHRSDENVQMLKEIFDRK